MPSLKDAIQKNINRIAAGGATGTGVGTPEQPKVLPVTPTLDMPIGGGLPQRGTFPAASILASDFSDSNREYRGMGLRSAAFPYQQQPAQVNKTVVQTTAAPVAPSNSITIEVNGTPTPSQKIANFIGLGGTTITFDSTGGIYFSSTSTGDGLIHGDTIWWGDPAFIYLRDDFIGGGNSTGAIGDSGAWTLISGFSSVISGNTPNFGPPMMGALALLTPTSANTGGGIYMGNLTANNSETQPLFPLFDYPSWQMEYVFSIQRYSAVAGTTSPFPLAKTCLYLGCSSWGGVVMSTTQMRPQFFVGLRFDTDTSAPSIADTTFHFEAVANALGFSSTTRNNAQGNTYDTGIVPTEAVVYKLIMLYTTVGKIQMRLISSDGHDTGFQTLTVPQYTYTAGNSTDSQGITDIVPSETGVTFINAAPGSKVSVTGWTGGTAGSSFTVQMCRYNDVSFTWFNGSKTYGSATQTGAQYKMYPGVTMQWGWGNDTAASPTNNRMLYIDFWSFVWNPAVGGGTASPNAALPRFF